MLHISWCTNNSDGFCVNTRSHLTCMVGDGIGYGIGGWLASKLVMELVIGLVMELVGVAS